MSQKHEISCWKCHEMTSLETRNEFDGCCWACGEEIDLDDYLIKAMDKRDEHYAALVAVTAERDRVLAEREGNVLVPTEPTEAMLTAYSTNPNHVASAGAIYRAMLSAAMAAKEA